MSEAFRCDACDEYHGGKPTEIQVANEYHTIGQTISVGNSAGSDDAHPGERDKFVEEVRWPWNTRYLELCATCTVEYLVDPLLDASMQGRYALDQRYETSDSGPDPWAQDPNVPSRQPAFCPYCGESPAFDGQGPRSGGYQHRCPECGYKFITLTERDDA